MKKPKINIKPNEERLCCVYCGMPLAVYRYKPMLKFYGKSISKMLRKYEK